MNKSKGAGKHAGAAAGKGFYIVLCLCAAVIGVSAWILLADKGTNVDESESAQAAAVDVSEAVVTMLPAEAEEDAQEQSDEDAEEAEADAETEPEEEEDEAQEVFSETVTSYVWPVRGDVEVPYAMETLLYDATMADWRTHDGIDIASDLGTQVMAVAGGTVVSVTDDDLAGTTVEIDHANGIHSVYSNLAAEPPVGEGDVVTMGQVIGSVGSTALAESNVAPHLHFAMTCDGSSVDPTEYLPTEWTD